MKNAVFEVKEKSSKNKENLVDQVTNCDVPGDGSWQKREYSSKNDIIAAISKDNGKVLDFTVLKKNCKACKYWEKKKETPEYEQFLLEHDCPINQEQSLSSMESAGAVPSIVCNKLRYKTYIGERDTQSYHEVVKSDPQPGLSIKKG